MKNNKQNNSNRKRNPVYENDQNRQSSGSRNQNSHVNNFSEYDDDPAYPNQHDSGQRSHFGSQRRRYNEGPQNLESEFGRSRERDYEGDRK